MNPLLALFAPVAAAVLLAGVWLVRRVPPAELRPPDPTPAQARAIVVGTAGSWFLWAPLVLAIPDSLAIAAVAGPVFFAVTTWLFLAGFASVLGGATAALEDPRRSYVVTLDYYRRCAAVLGWPPMVVLGGLGTLLSIDMAAATLSLAALV